MSRKIARITQEKKLLLANEVVESNAKTSLNSDGRLEVDEIIEYPAELEGGRNLIQKSWLKNNADIDYYTGLERSSGNRTIITEFIQVTPQQTYMLQRPVDQGNVGARYYDSDKNHIGSENLGSRRVYELNIPDGCYYFKFIDEANTLDEGYKFEKGNKATDWTPAPEDLGLNYPDSIQNFNSSISGNNIIAPEFIEGYPFVKPVIDDSLVLWLDGSTGNNYEKTNIWKDLSGNGNDGQLMNFDFTEDSGWVDGGLKFDGVKRKDYVLFSKEMLVQGCSFSIDFWTKLSGIGTNCFFCARTVLGAGVAIFALSDNKIRFDTGRGYQWQTSYGIPTNELVNIVVTKDDNYKKLYVNGKLYSSTGTVGDMSNLSNVSTIGASQIDNQSYNNFLKGDIYSFRIYNRALTDEEILQNYQAGQCSPLLAMRGEVIG